MHKKGVGVAILNRTNAQKGSGGRESEQNKMQRNGVGVANPNRKFAQKGCGGRNSAQKKMSQKGVGFANPNKIKCTSQVWGSQIRTD